MVEAAVTADNTCDTKPLRVGLDIGSTTVKAVVLDQTNALNDVLFSDYRRHHANVRATVAGLLKDIHQTLVDLGRGEAIIRRDEMIPRETFKVGDRARAYVYDVRREPRGPQIFLSRTDPQFMAELFKMEVPEIYDGVIEIKAVAYSPRKDVEQAPR